jgi:hypothetical protein
VSPRPSSPPSGFRPLVQWHADEIEILYASLGETTDHAGFAEHLQAQLARGDGSALVPPDRDLWRAVAEELDRRGAGVVTAENRAWFDGLEG